MSTVSKAGDFSQIAINYVTGAINGVDGFDAIYFNDSSITLTTNINNEEYTIQGRAILFNPGDVLALNLKTDADQVIHHSS